MIVFYTNAWYLGHTGIKIVRHKNEFKIKMRFLDHEQQQQQRADRSFSLSTLQPDAEI